MTAEQADGLAREYIERIIETQRKLGKPTVPAAAKRAAVADVQYATRQFAAIAKKRAASRGLDGSAGSPEKQ